MMTANQRGAAAAAAWEAEAIEKCRNDPNVIAAGLCPVCMCDHPCICDEDIIVREMRAYFDRNPKGDKTRAEAVSWGAGEPIAELIRGLLHIAEDGLTKAREDRGLTSSWRHKDGTAWEPPRVSLVATPPPAPPPSRPMIPKPRPFWQRLFGTDVHG